MLAVLQTRADVASVILQKSGAGLLVHHEGILESATSLNGPFHRVTGAANPFEPILDGPQQFWRAALPRLTVIAAGSRHSAAVRSDGTLWTWGWDNHGQLGDGGSNNVAFPQRVGAGVDWGFVSAGEGHTVALREDGTLWAWGMNSSGQLGIGSVGDDMRTPLQVGTNANWKTVSAGAFFTVGLRTDGTLWTWGRNSNYELGNGTNTIISEPQQIGSDTNWAAVAAGRWHTLALRLDGSLWAWGDNFAGQIGNGVSGGQATSPVEVGVGRTWKAIAAGGYNSAAVAADGSLWTWGDNRDGQLGIGLRSIESSTNIPVQIGTNLIWKTVAVGKAVPASFTMAVREDGTLWACGPNTAGELGLGTNGVNTSVDLLTQIGSNSDWMSLAAGQAHTLALRRDGTLWTWGWNANGQLGVDAPAVINSPQQVGPYRGPYVPFARWQAMSAGESHSLALRTDGSVWSWGNNTEGQLGVPGMSMTNSPQRVALAGLGQSIAAGGGHSLALLADGSLWSWGHNAEGQLGLGHNNSTNQPQRMTSPSLFPWKAVAAGYQHTLALRTDGSLWTWGYNIFGQSGIGVGTSTANTPQLVGGGAKWKAVAAGHYHSAALRLDGTLWAWGYNRGGAVGNGEFATNSPSYGVFTPVQVGTASNWVAVACGAFHTVALRADGTLWAWGANNFGQVGNGTFAPDATTGGVSAPLQIGSETSWQAIAAGGKHSMAVRGDGSLWTWGGNDRGQLGDGTITRSSPYGVSAPQSIAAYAQWQALAAGEFHSLGLRADGTLWAWGGNDAGQLGIATYNQVDPFGEPLAHQVNVNVLW